MLPSLTAASPVPKTYQSSPGPPATRAGSCTWTSPAGGRTAGAGSAAAGAAAAIRVRASSAAAGAGRTGRCAMAGSSRRGAGGAGRSFEAGVGDAADDLRLEGEEDGDQRGGAERRGRHLLGVLDAVGALHGPQPDRDRHQRRVGGGHEGPQEVVPGLDEGEDGDGGEDRP